MCKFNIFCGCCTLRGAAITGFVLSIIRFLIIFLELIIYFIYLGTKIATTGETDVYICVIISIDIVEFIILISGTICLGIAVIQDAKSKLVAVWLIVSMICLVIWTALVILQLVRFFTQEHTKPETENTSNETTTEVRSSWTPDIFDLVVYCIIMPFLIYVWIGVLNYYWLLENRETRV